MRAAGHLAGGVAAGAAVAGAASAAGAIAGVGDPRWWAVFATALFFALFPDVDTDSLPRRWFYRAVLAALLWLAWSGRWQMATLLAVVSTLPLVDHHRGWTHGRLTPVLAVALLGAGCLWWRGDLPRAWESGGASIPPADLVLLAAALAGWYTHLFLDGRFRLFPEDAR